MIDSMSRKLVVFDLDGTLVDTREAMRKAFYSACGAVGLQQPPPFEEYMRHLGAPLPTILSIMNLPAGMEPHFKTEAQKLLHLTSMLPSLRDDLLFLRARGYCLAIFTGKDAKRTGEMLKYFDIDRLFEVVITGDDVKNGKPDPEGLITILSKTGVRAGDAVYIGDSAYDILCAKRAKAFAIAACWGMATRIELESACPDLLLNDPSELRGAISALFGAGSQKRTSAAAEVGG
jgi:3-amino-5-hydroxybenzoic acid synthesis related protein